MAKARPLMKTTPRARASVARSTADTSSLVENEVVFVQRTGPRILTIPSQNPTPLGDEALHNLQRGRFTHELAGGRRIAGPRMMACSDIEVEKNGSYTLKKKDAAYKEMDSVTVKTLDVWTGQVGKLRQDIDINNLTFYSLDEFQLPSYHSWKDHDAENAVLEHVGLDIEPSSLDSIEATGRYIDLAQEAREAAAAEKISNDPEEKLRTKPDITPSDEAWEEVEEFFAWILEDERKKKTPRINRLIREEFNEAQRLLLTPTAYTTLRAQIQEENTLRYQEALKTTFSSKTDNLVTKLTMVCFGLPIAPITVKNIKYAGGEDDVPDNVAEDAFEGQNQRMRTVLWSEKPLEFLDNYHTRSYGYPTVRTKKRPHNAIATKSTDDAPKSKIIRLPDSPWVTNRIPCGQSNNSPSEVPGLRLRGGARSPPKRNYQILARTTQRFHAYTEFGNFEIEKTYAALHGLISRLFRASSDEFNFEIDILQDGPPDSNGYPDVIQTFSWNNSAGDVFDESKFKIHVEGEEFLNKHYKLRVRHGGQPRQPYEPNLSDVDIVELHLEDFGTAYWHLPLNGDKATGINQHQDTFRNAIECLLPEHRQFVVDWDCQVTDKIKKDGRLVLAAEAPSEKLWDLIVLNKTALLSSRHTRINLRVVPKKELKATQSREGSSKNEGEIMIIVPGSAEIIKSPLYGGHDHEKFLERIRKAVHARTSPQTPPIRLWPGPENYSSELQDLRSVVIPPTSEIGDAGLLVNAAIVLTADAVVARPEFSNFKVTDYDDGSKSVSWDPAMVLSAETSKRNSGGLKDYYSLTSFRKTVKKLWPDYEKNEHFSIVESPRHSTFIIGPAMTELQWRTQVFDWLCDKNVLVQRNQGVALLYKMSRWKGPLGETCSDGVAPTESEEVVYESAPNSTTNPIAETPAEVIPSKNNSKTVWNEWVKKQDDAYKERLAAFTADPSIFRRGKNAAVDISIFGQSFEQGISVGSLMPSVFTQMKTPAQANDLQRENRKLENIILDRITFCQMCSFTFSSGLVGEESKRKHLQEHIAVLQEFEKAGPGNSKQGLGGKLPGVYCGVCGKTEEEFAQENPDIAHSQTCMEVMISRNIHGPQFCHHCGLNLPGEGFTDDDAKVHIANCTNQSRGSGAQSQIAAIFQRLLKRLTGQNSLPPSELRCHFQQCDQVFKTGSSDAEKVKHFLSHLDSGNPQERVTCQFPNCKTDLGGLTGAAVSRHLGSHYTRNLPPRPHPKSPPPNTVFNGPQYHPDEVQPDKGEKDELGPKDDEPDEVDPDEDQKNIPARLKEKHPGKNFYCPVCYKLLGKQPSPCNWHRSNCQIFGHNEWLIMSAATMTKYKETNPKPKTKKKKSKSKTTQGQSKSTQGQKRMATIESDGDSYEEPVVKKRKSKTTQGQKKRATTESDSYSYEEPVAKKPKRAERPRKTKGKN